MNDFDPNQNPAQPASPQGQQDPAAQQGGAQPAAGQPAAQAPAGSNLGGIMEENVDVGDLVSNAGQNQQASQALLAMQIPAHPNTTFDEQKFLQLLAGSISLTLNEKKNIITAIPQLSQFQVDELMKIFEEERGKFAELEQKHAQQVAELEKQHAAGNPEALQAKQEEEVKRNQEEDEAEAIKRSLGL